MEHIEMARRALRSPGRIRRRWTWVWVSLAISVNLVLFMQGRDEWRGDLATARSELTAATTELRTEVAELRSELTVLRKAVGTDEVDVRSGLDSLGERVDRIGG